MTSLPARRIVTFLFFLSGFAALAYQVAWQRLLVVFAGGDVYSITIIVAAFMVGLGCGNLAGGSLADRNTSRRNLLLFGAAEAGITLFGLASKYLFYDLLYLKLGGVADSRVLTAFVLLLALLIPTFLMGMSLPLLARALIQSLPDAAVKIGRLYGINTLGAAVGALVTTWVLMPLHGMEGSIRAAALLNAICAVVVLPLAWRRRTPNDPPAQTGDLEQFASVEPTTPWSVRRCVLIYGLSGFIALALEMVWFRLLGVMLKSTAFTFGTLLSFYLAGVGIGSLVGTALTPRVRRPGTWFLNLQCAIGLYAGLATFALLAAVHHWPSLAAVRNYFDSYEPIDANTAVAVLQRWLNGSAQPEERAWAWIFPTLHFGLPLLLIAPPTLLMGLSFPLLQKAVHNDLAQIGRRIGWIQTANIAGSLLGTVVVTVCLLPWLGTAATLRMLVALSGLFGLMAILESSKRRFHPYHLAGVAVLVAALVLIPNQRALWARAHGTTPEQIHLAEDGAGVSLLKKPAPNAAAGTPTMVLVNGIGQSWIPFGGTHSVLGALPSLLHPNPERIAIIGLGSGDTLFSAAFRPETREIVCVEIVGAELETLRMQRAEAGYEGLRVCLEDPRIRHLNGDGRLFLMTTDQRFDIIEADALRPTSAHAGNLYSEEYFRLLSRRLKPGGYAVTWTPTQRVLNTFVRVFPYCLIFPDTEIVIGSNDPIHVDTSALQRLNDRGVLKHYERAGIDLRALLEPCLGKDARMVAFDPQTDRVSLTDFNTDVFPKDELCLPALWGEKAGAQ